MAIAISTDIGGTFTDLVVYDLATGTIHQAKDYTDPDDLSSGIARCVDKSGFSLVDAPEFVHGSTVAINAAIERKGAPTAILVTRGMRDVYEIGRGNRPEAYNMMFKRPVPLVGRESIYEVDERLAAGGDVITPLDEASVRRAVEAAVAGGARAIAVCLLHSYANPAHEERIGALVREIAPQLYLTLSHQILREYREYERISTAAMNAYIGPRVSGYLDDLKGVLSARSFSGRTLIMQSSPPRAASPTPSRSTWAARRPRPPCSGRAPPTSPRATTSAASRPGFRCGCRSWTWSRSAPAAAASPTSTTPARCASARRAPAAGPARSATAGAVPGPPSPTPTRFSAASTRPTSSAAR
jgi:hypothetical protein